MARKKWRFDRAEITFSSSDISIVLSPRYHAVDLMIGCKEPDLQALLLVQVCSQLSLLVTAKVLAHNTRLNST